MPEFKRRMRYNLFGVADAVARGSECCEDVSTGLVQAACAGCGRIHTGAVNIRHQADAFAIKDINIIGRFCTGQEGFPDDPFIFGFGARACIGINAHMANPCGHAEGYGWCVGQCFGHHRV